MQISNVLIYIAGILWSIELIPQLLHTMKTKNTQGISPVYFVLCLIAYIFYTIGNILNKNWIIIIAHIPSIITVSLMLILIFKYQKSK